ncbi:hypothetical protein DCS_06832 [Drechmeria coniospora]|uniref:Uncharacterized protein n=1 Tax=Drechmeria coniospora TaxID=98403 RepID=A0A151GCT7_DRECN|nr:hypothetical protein DCS_06832 [Drechmeria coniospora]KYK54871.1 hypothetical protein DCS_06832 [Drechmeria coniospora]
MAAHWWALRAIIAFEILRQPGFHRAVGRIHRTVHERKHGRNPREPLAPGEATAEPGRRGFLRLFFDELKNQFQGKPTDLPHNKPPK